MNRREVSKVVVLVLVFLVLPVIAHAAGSGLPWEGPLQRILDSIAGPVAKVVGVIAIVVTGLGLAFGESGGLMRKILSIVFGLSIAFSASSFALSFFGFAGGSAF